MNTMQKHFLINVNDYIPVFFELYYNQIYE
jgi:hypothetical protein